MKNPNLLTKVLTLVVLINLSLFAFDRWLDQSLALPFAAFVSVIVLSVLYRRHLLGRLVIGSVLALALFMTLDLLDADVTPVLRF